MKEYIWQIIEKTINEVPWALLFEISASLKGCLQYFPR